VGGTLQHHLDINTREVDRGDETHGVRATKKGGRLGVSSGREKQKIVSGLGNPSFPKPGTGDVTSRKTDKIPEGEALKPDKKKKGDGKSKEWSSVLKRRDSRASKVNFS